MTNHYFPIWKKSRSLGISLNGDNREFAKKTSLPGQHGKRRKYLSTYAKQNLEKNKAMCIFGFIKERQLHNAFKITKKHKGNIEENLQIHLISYLVNIIYFSGLALTRNFSRQLISHGHFLVNDKKVDKFTFKLSPGDIVTIKNDKLKENEIIKKGLEKKRLVPEFINFDSKKIVINYLRYPNKEEIKKISKGIDFSLVIEWYNKK